MSGSPEPNPPEPVIRPFQEGDAERCADLFMETFAAPPWNEVWDRRVVLSRLEQIAGTPHFFGLTAESGSMAGFVMGYSEPWHQGTHFYLKEMCVHPRRQRQGLGTRLMSTLIAELRQRATERIYLLTARGDSAEAFYGKQGFLTSPKMILMRRFIN